MAFRTPKQLLVAAGLCVLAFGALLAVAYGSRPAARVDATAFEEFGDQLQRPLVARAAERVAHLADPGPFLLLVLVVVGAALLARGPRPALAVAAAVVGANVTTQLLKPLLAEPRGTLGGWTFGPEGFPSGHSTAAMSLALAAVVVSPRSLRPVVALAGAAFAIGVGFALVTLDAHFPSDVAGGYLVAAAWCFAAQAAVARIERRQPGEEWRFGPLSALPLGFLLGLTVLGATRLPELVDYARGHTAFAVVAVATAALATLLVAATAAFAPSPRRA